MLFVKIIRLDSSVKKSDWFSKNDIFIKIKYGNDHRRTTVKWDSDNPKWNESFLFENILYNEKYIEFEICDCDKWSQDEVLERYKYKIDYNNEKIRKIKIGKIFINIGDIFYNHKKEIEKMKNSSKNCEKYKELLDKFKWFYNENMTDI